MARKFDDNIPIYIQVMDDIKRMIVSGRLQPGEQIKSVRDLALDYSINPNTVQKALQELEKEGLLKSERTAGRFIQADAEKIAGIREDMARSQIRTYFSSMAEIGFNREEAAAKIRDYGKENSHE